MLNPILPVYITIN